MAHGPALLAFLLVSLAVAASLLLGARLLRVRARSSSRLKWETYECGETPTGLAWVRFHARYYVVALFFVLFDIEAALVLPWGVITRELGPGGLWAVVTFVGVLMLGWVWGIRKGALEWM
ncbi:MAG TPA: NADH-quinone oxidoreductase subunit A [Myxococcaceae bacterium]|jgi:NADH-quinone oxidoreductase subunit A|nr:NADH-quinone oxidoreductase subunit A [Myxococcaceae bacterium]